MRTNSILGAALCAALTGGGLFAACFDYADDCVLNATCCPDGTLSCLSTSSSTGGHDGGPSDAGDGGPSNCDPLMGVVSDMCGVFVSPSGDDASAGTMAKPLKTLGAAVKKGGAVYACAGAAPYSEAVTVEKAVKLYGALDCATWKHAAGTKTQLTAPSDAVPLTLASGASGSDVEDFAITAADATVAGGSSIAVLDDGADLTLVRVDVIAGAGKDGAPGMAQNQVMTPTTANGQPGSDDAMCNMAGPIPGGNGGKNTCGMTDTSGGGGGNGFAASAGGDGSQGQPAMMTSNGGSGETKTASCNMNNPKGSDGSVGAPGTGARGIGDISATGYAGPAGAVGGSGTPGQGGGGGGGARQCDVNGMFAGPSGGGGGAGGCGGTAGNLGQSGGSSIGILVLGATPVLDSVSITTHDGGAGGLGGDGQLGAAGGQPGGAGGANACVGGTGGEGGPGGPGSGGAGGHSAGIALKGAKLPDLSNTTIVLGSAGIGGAGGDMDMTAQTKGDGGMACKTLDFTNPSSPTACAM